MNIYPGDVVSKDVLKSFRNLLQGGDRTSAKKLDKDFDILWVSKGGNVDLSKWSKDDFSTDLIPDYIDCKYFAGKPVVTKNFGLCFAVLFPVGACRKKLISDPDMHLKIAPTSQVVIAEITCTSVHLPAVTTGGSAEDMLSLL